MSDDGGIIWRKEMEAVEERKQFSINWAVFAREEKWREQSI